MFSIVAVAVYMSYLYILDSNPLSDIMICKYFPPLHRLPFHFAEDFLAVQKLFSMI